MNNDWVFDSNIEKIYNEHVKAHIPNYDRVIQKSLDVCQKVCKNSDPIIDIGCANGATLTKLNRLGFNNLHGVEASADMIKNFNSDIAKITISDVLPKNEYKVVLANWVLHFIKNKKQYIKDVYDSLQTGGVLILSEKTSKEQELTFYYHLFKQRSGVSESEIISKSKSLENVMFIDSCEWYLETLKAIGFKNIHVIDADWCFATFYAEK